MVAVSEWWNTVPSFGHFEEVSAELSEHLRGLKRIKVPEGLPIETLAAEYLRFHQAFEEYQLFLRHRARGFNRTWWSFPEVDLVRRRALRWRSLSLAHLGVLHAAMLAGGDPGIAAIRKMFLDGNHSVHWAFCYDATEHFPDDAEPIFEAILALPSEGVIAVQQRRYEDLLKKIKGHRARLASPLSPAFERGLGIGLAPSLPTIDRSPAEFPELLFERFAANVFTGTMAFDAALIDAWKKVVDEKRLDAAYYEQANVAEFDLEVRRVLSAAIFDYCRDSHMRQNIERCHFSYIDVDGSVVAADELAQALIFVILLTRNMPYELALRWSPASILRGS
jgi:hypothetical protein